MRHLIHYHLFFNLTFSITIGSSLSITTTICILHYNTLHKSLILFVKYSINENLKISNIQDMRLYEIVGYERRKSEASEDIGVRVLIYFVLQFFCFFKSGIILTAIDSVISCTST